MKNIPRPSHADYTYEEKYSIHASSGGGRASARETIGRVASGAVAEKWLKEVFNVEIVAWVSSVGEVSINETKVDLLNITRKEVDESGPIRCPDKETGQEMVKLIEQVRKEKDSVGGVITCVCRNVPVGWFEVVSIKKSF